MIDYDQFQPQITSRELHHLIISDTASILKFSLLSRPTLYGALFLRSYNLCTLYILDLSSCLKIWNETHDPEKALTAVKGNQRHTKLETILLKGLKRHGLENYSDAIREVCAISNLLVDLFLMIFFV